MKKPLKAWAVYKKGLFWVCRSRKQADVLAGVFRNTRIIHVEIKELK